MENHERRLLMTVIYQLTRAVGTLQALHEDGSSGQPDTETGMSVTTEIALKKPAPELLKRGKKPQRKFVHRCADCGGDWIDDEPSPPHCYYCSSRRWKTRRSK